MAEQTHFIADLNNSKLVGGWPLNSSAPTGFFSSSDKGVRLDLNYNGVDVYYFPKSYVEKGHVNGSVGNLPYPKKGGYVHSSGNAYWTGDAVFLNQSTWDFLKPTKLEDNLVNDIASKTTKAASSFLGPSNIAGNEGKLYQASTDIRDVENFKDGYIIEKSKYHELAKQINPVQSSVFGLFSPPRIPSGLATAPDGNLSYVGYTKNGGGFDRRSDLLYVNSKQSFGYYQYQWQNCGALGCGVSDFLGSTLGQLITLGARIYSPWFNLGYTVGNAAFNDGKLGDVALAVINLNMPAPGGSTPAAGTVFNIPQIASMGSKIAEFYTPYLGAEAAKAASFVTVNAGLNYLSNGQNFERAMTTAAAQYVGDQAGAQVAKSLASFGTDVQKIMSATSTAVTKAALLNQDVEQAGLSAFVTTSIPLAVDGALKSANLTLSSNVKKTISDAAIQAALLPNANVDEILRSAAIGGLTRAVSDKVSNDSVASKVIKSDDKAAMEKIFAYVGQYFSGRSVDEIVNSAVVNNALKAADSDIKEYSATMKGWVNWDQFQTAQKLFGSDVTPEFYDARVVSREKIIPILQQENVPESDWQNIIDFYEGTVGANSTAAQVLGDIRNFVNPLYMTGAEREYVTRAFAGLEEFDQEKYQALYDRALDLAKRNQYGAVEEIVNWVNQNYTSTNESINFWKEAFKFVGVDDYQPTQQQIDMIKGRNQIAAYTIAQHIAGERSVTFDATQFSNPKEAEEAARKANFNNFEFNDGIVYKVTTPINEALIRDEIAKQPTYAGALGKARAELGPGKTFMYGGNQYTTNIAPTGVFDASMSSDPAQSALLAYANNKMTFLARDGKIYTIPESAKAALEAASNTSPAEAKRILEQSINLYPDQTLNETARLLEAPGKEKMDYLSAATAGALGTSLNGLAQFLEEGAKSYALLTGDYSFDNAGVRLAGELEEYAKSKDPFGMDLQMYRFSVAMTEVANEKDPIKQTQMFAEAVNNNKLAFMKIAGSEAVAELPYIAAFVGASLALAPIGAGAVLVGGGVITATSVLMETTGTAAESAYNASKAQGDSEEVARDKALLNAGSAWLIETGTDFIANKFLLGSVGTDGVKSITKALGVGASNAGIGGVTNLAQGFSQSLAEQLIINPNNVSVNKAYADGMLEFAIGGTAQGVLGIAGYALMPNTVIGKDYSGGNVTLNDILLHDKVLDSSTVDPNVVVGITGNNNSFTLGGMFTNMPAYNFNTQIQQTYLPQIYNNPEMVVGFDPFGNNITYGQVLAKTNSQTSYQQAFTTMVNPTFEQKNEAQREVLRQEFQRIGYTPSQEQINSLIIDNPNGTQGLIDSAKTVAFKDIAVQENYQLSDATLTSLLKSGVNTVAQFKAYVDPQSVTQQEARDFLASRGYTEPTQEEINRVVAAGLEKDAETLATTIADSYAAKNISQLRNELLNTIEYVKQSGLTGDAALQTAIDTVAGNLGTTRSDLLNRLGATESTLRQDFATQLGAVQTQIGDIESRLGQAIQAARQAGLTGDAALQSAINSVSAELGTTKADVLAQLGTTETALRADFATQLGEVQQQVTDVEARLAQAIEAAKQSGLTGDEALQSAINDVAASLGTTKTDLLTQLGTTEAELRADFATQIGTVQTQIGNVESRLSQAIESAKQAGLTGDAALQQAINLVADDLGITRSDVLSRLGKTEETLRAELASGLAGVSAEVQAAYNALSAEQKVLANTLTAQGKSLSEAIAAVQTQTTEQIAGVESRLTSAIAAAEAAGQTRDQALQSAVDAVATELGTTREGLLAQLGTTEAALRQEFGAGLAGVSEELQTAYAALTAEQKALADSVLAQGKTLTEALAAVESGLSGQITDVEERLQKAISDNEAAGLTRDEALQAALDSVSGELGTTRADLLAQLGTTEEALRAELASGLAGVSAELQAAYNALSAEQKALADSQRAQGATLAEAIATVQAQTSQQIADVESRFTSALAAAEAAGMSRDEALQQALTDVAASLGTTRSDLLSRLGTTEDALRAEFGTGLAGVSAEVKAAYDALSAEQKSLADNLVAQGKTLGEAIQSVQASLSGQISGLSADLQAKYDTLTAGQKDIVDRLVQQGDNLTTAINTVSSELSGQIQTSAAETQAILLAKMREYEQAGLSRDEAMNRAIGDVSTELGVTRNQLSTQIGRPAIQDDPTTIDVNEAEAPTGIYKIMADYDAAAAQRDLELQEQMEAEALARRIEAQERSSAAQRAQLLGKAPSLLQQGMAGILPFLGAAAVAPDEGAKFKSPFITSKTGQEEFGGTLEEFQKRVAQTDYTSPEFGDAQMQEFMGMPQNTEQGESMPNYFTYGEQSDIDRMFNPFASAAASFNPFQPMLAAKGGLAVLMANGGYAGGGLPVVHHSGKQRLDFREGAAVSGPGDGQSDDIPAMLADGEFVFPADVVAALGNGSTKAGSDKLYDMMHSIRAYHRSAKPQDLPPPAKASPLDYIKKSRR